MIRMSLRLAVPFGIFAAIYLVEYAKKGNKMISVVRVTAETLSGIPSIVYGLFGMLFFVTALHWEFSMPVSYTHLRITPIILWAMWQMRERSNNIEEKGSDRLCNCGSGSSACF